MSIGAFFEAAIANQWLGGTAPSIPATWYVALFDLTNTELAGNGYARVAVTNNTTNWPAGTGSVPLAKANGIAVVFPTATPSAWNAAAWFGLYDAATNGHLFGPFPLLTPVITTAGNAATFAIGSLVTQWT